MSLSLSLSKQLKPTLSQLHADLKSFEHHFDWLINVTRRHQHSSSRKVGEMMSHMRNLINSLQRQVTRLHHLCPPSPEL